MYYTDTLIGLKVTGLKEEFHTGSESITFLVDGGKSFTIYSEGDCCSHSWFEHLELPKFPFTIQKVEEVDMGEISSSYNDEYELIQQYSLKVTTDTGYLDLEMRNSSNGYYGGSYELDTTNLNLTNENFD